MRTERPQVDAKLRVLAVSPPCQLSRPTAELLRDDTVNACLNILYNVIAGNSWVIYPSDAPEPVQNLAQRMADTEGFGNALRHLCTGLFTGSAVVEVIWGKDYLPKAYRSIDYDAVDPRVDEYGQVRHFEVRTNAGLQELPLTRSMYLIHNPRIGQATGESLLQIVEPLTNLRAALRMSIQQFADRHAVPPIMGVFPASFSDEEIDSFFTALKKLHKSKIFAVPMLANETPQVQFLEPRANSIDWALTAYQQASYDIARVLLGPILALFEAQFGTRAQAQVHHQLLMQVIRGMQSAVESAVTRHFQLLCQLHGLEPSYRWRLTEPPLRTSDTVIQNLPELMTIGIITSDDTKAIRAMLNLPES